MMMKLLRFTLLLATAGCLGACSNDVQIGDNTFVHKDKIYRVIDNEIREIGDLSAGNIKKFEVSSPKQKDLGTTSLSFVKEGASTSLKALYRGNFLYYTLTVDGINDLRDSYSPGELTIEFVDEYGFIMHSTKIETSDLTGMIGEDGKPHSFVYHGKTEMSLDINAAIRSYNVTAGIKRKILF
jgi:hypothetical protein